MILPERKVVLFFPPPFWSLFVFKPKLSAFNEDWSFHWISCVTCLLWVDKLNFLLNKAHNHITCVGCSCKDNMTRPHEDDLVMSCVQQADRIIVTSHWFHTTQSICITQICHPEGWLSWAGNVVPTMGKSSHRNLPSWSTSK